MCCIWVLAKNGERALLNRRFHIGSGPSEFIWEFVSVGQIQETLEGKQKPLGKTVNEMR